MILLKISFFVASLVALTNCNVLREAEPVPDNDIRQIVGDYIPRGHVVNIGNLPVYESPVTGGGSTRMLIVIHDIFGFGSTNLRQVTDVMAQQYSGFRTILPDFFRGESWDRNIPVDPNNTPPALQQLLDRAGDWNTIVRPDLINLIRHYQGQGVQQFAIFGMCWGGSVATRAAIELFTEFRASAFIHPLQVTNAQAPLVRLPMFLLPSRDEPNMLPFYDVIRANFGDNSGHRRFDDMFHGFSSTIGNFNNPQNQASVNEVIRLLGTFFQRNV